jgi:hypothetical protein
MFNFYIQNVLQNRADYEHYVSRYLSNPENPSYKVKFFKRVFVDMQSDNITWLFGVGPGKLGSRASNTLSYDILYKDGQKIPSFIGPHSSPWAKRIMSDLWTEGISRRMKGISSTLANPFTGIASIKGELGLVGLILFLFVMIVQSLNVLRSTQKFEKYQLQTWGIVLSICWLSIPLLMIIDNYMEKPQIMIPLFLLSCLLVNSKHDKPSIDSELKELSTESYDT